MSPRRAGTATAPRARRRPRRTQEERSTETRAKVVRAAAECLAEQGFRATTMSAIASRAGVSWGAMQHQFGDKDSILDAVLAESLVELEQALADLAAEPDPVRRVRSFVRRSRELLHRSSYRAFVEIQLSRGRDDGESARAWAAYVGEVLGRIWRSLFGDLDLPPRRLADSRRFTFVVLSGVAAESMLFPGVDFSRQHLGILEETLLRLLGLESR